MPKISILMAVHNPNMDYFHECLNAIENQTFQDFELIIIDDQTTTCIIEDILNQYSFSYKIIKNTHNLGLAKSLNRGLEICNGEYIARMDDDDIMYENRLQEQYSYSLNHNGFIFCDVDIIDLEGKIIKSSLKNNINIKEYLKKSGNCLTHSSLFVKKQILEELGGYDERFIYAQDYALYMKAIDKYEFYNINKSLVKYRLPIVRNSKMKKILSLLSCYAAFVYYVSQNKNIKNLFFYFRRSLSLIKLLLNYIIDK